MTRGGKRPGSGRKPGYKKPDSERKDHTINIRVTNKRYAWLKDKKNIGKLIERALDEVYPIDGGENEV